MKEGPRSEMTFTDFFIVKIVKIDVCVGHRSQHHDINMCKNLLLWRTC